ncbi:methyltransferase domain-containing protein [Aureimonas fodinaquatilis]|uniref:Methyltransferase domain-containing protein n=1 Tax=Aureimonas fodinaquatilis TaxID=2565783 RepID=A0A5B0DSE8_9HYPH|nr:methyltransferase domain-containing protein [Aureimonas fodinaquatilis]KAA0968490.1 methyltransferase domain-containing protein [Aureimonas fodinaquatilis]
MSEMQKTRGDWAKFFGTWLRHPVKMGAVAASSDEYCDEMVSHSTIDLPGRILELGPGLGAVTKALLRAGVDPARIVSIEYDADFAKALKQRFPGITVINGDGFDLDATLGDGGAEKFATILFAIPIVNMKQAERQALLQRYFTRMTPGGKLTQLSYLWKPPVKPVSGFFDVTCSRVIWNNIPPARVWIYSRDNTNR